jgi:hypothetical protein
MEKIQKLKELIAAAEVDADKFFNKGNSAAGTRLRGAMQQIKVIAQGLRAAVTDEKNSK